MSTNQFLHSMLSKTVMTATVLSFFCPTGFTQFVAIRETPASQEAPASQETLSRESRSRLPKVPSVKDMVRPRQAIEIALAKTPSESVYESMAVLGDNRIRSTQSSHDDMELETLWGGSVAGWSPARFSTNPLFFEQPHLERFDSKSPAWTRPALSYAHFLATIPILPYKMGAHLPSEKMRTIEHYREGVNLDRKSSPGNIRRGILFQGAATTGLIFLLP